MNIQSKTYYYESFDKVKATALTTALSTGFCAVARNVTVLKVFSALTYTQAIGFGLVTEGIATFAMRYISKWVSDAWINTALSHMAGGSIAYAGIYGLKALGFIALPISIPSAIALTVIAVAFAIFYPHHTCNVVYKNGNLFKGMIDRKGERVNGRWDNPRNGDYKIGTFKNDQLYDGIWRMQSDGLIFEHRFIQGQGKAIKTTDKEKTIRELVKEDDYFGVGPGMKTVTLQRGQTTWANGDHFYGTYVDGEPLVGIGCLTINKTVYDGTFEKHDFFDEAVLVDGLMKKENGDHFKGSFDRRRRNPLNGTGRLTKGTEVFEGKFVNGQLKKDVT